MFMSGLSTCLFEWDEADNQLLARAKRGELNQAGVTILLKVPFGRLSPGRRWQHIAAGGLKEPLNQPILLSHCCWLCQQLPIVLVCGSLRRT